MNLSAIASVAFTLAILALLAAFIATLHRPGIFRAEPRRTIERVDNALYRYSPSRHDVSQALQFLEYAVSTDQDVSRVASDTRDLLMRRIALIDRLADRLGRFADMEDGPAPLGYMSELPEGGTPVDAIARAREWTSVSPQPYQANIAFDSARAALKAGLDPAPALAEARAVLARHSLSLQSALEELEAIR